LLSLVGLAVCGFTPQAGLPVAGGAQGVPAAQPRHIACPESIPSEAQAPFLSFSAHYDPWKNFPELHEVILPEATLGEYHIAGW
jgi:hypothetical protein